MDSFINKEDNKLHFWNDLAELPANVNYMYNYEEAPNNGYYFIDDYDNEVIKYVPQDLEREGYAFGGWYKDIECIEIWVFETDVIPKKLIETSQDNKYQTSMIMWKLYFMLNE